MKNLEVPPNLKGSEIEFNQSKFIFEKSFADTFLGLRGSGDSVSEGVPFSNASKLLFSMDNLMLRFLSCSESIDFTALTEADEVSLGTD